MTNYLDELNEGQRAAVLYNDGPSLVIAGAGSGKTRVLTYKIAYLLDQGYKPWSILALTFTNKAAREMKERIARQVGENLARYLWMGTFHSIFSRILRAEADAIGFSSNFTIYDASDSKSLVKSIIREMGLDDKTYKPGVVQSRISQAKNHLILPDAYAASGELYRADADAKMPQLRDIYLRYWERCRQSDAMDFDDLLVKTVQLLQTQPDVLENYQERFRYIMVDEYQDTNHAQYVLTALLAAGHENICVVGDDDQSIYRFRGATIENILSFEKQYKNAKVIRLEQNYRSTQTILDAANAVIANNEQRKGKNLWTDNGQGAKIEFYVAEDEMAESRHVADTIVSNVADGEEWNDHAVLYRMNAQSNLIEQSFIRSGIPYRMIGGHRFYDRKEIKDAMAYLYVVNNTADEIRLRRIINEPKRGIGETSLNAVFEIANGLGVEPFEVIRSADQYAKLSRAASKLMAFGKLIDSFREKMEIMPLADLLGVILDETGYTLSLANEPEKYQERVANLAELGNNIRRYCEENPEGDLNGFLQETALLTDIDNYNAQTQAVVMMTIHSAKGLEFPNVFIVGMEEGIFPGMQTILYEPENIEEERRLAYVAITRAKKKLYISSASTRMLYGMTNRNRPSRFVEEIPEELLDKKGARPMSYQTHGIPQQRSAGQGSSSRGFSKISSQSPARASNSIPSKPAYSFSASSGFSGAGAKKPAAAAQSYSVGETVKHKAYGTGVILSMQKMANDTMLEIAFEKVGTKKIMANYAKLEKV